MSSQSLRVAYADFPPFVEIREENGKEILEGIMPEIVRALAQWMDLNLEWIREPEDRYGTWENNTWTGMCGMLFRNEVDLIVNPILPSFQYDEVVHLTNPITYEALTILSGKEIIGEGFFMYFSVLQPGVWGCIGITLVLMALISTIVHLRMLRSSTSWIVCFMETLWVYISMIFAEADRIKLKLSSRKRHAALLPLIEFLIILWDFGIAFLIMTAFQSLLTSKLTIVRSQPTVDSMEDYMRKDKILGKAPFEIELHEFLQDSGIQVYEDAYIKTEPGLVPNEEIFEEESFRALEEGTVCIFHGTLIMKSVLSEYFQEKGTCNFHISKNSFYTFPLLMALQRSLPIEFRRKFNYGLTRVIDADLSGKWFKPIAQTSQLCTSYSDNSLKPLSLTKIRGVLMLWVVGISASVIALIGERMVHATAQMDSRNRMRH